MENKLLQFRRRKLWRQQYEHFSIVTVKRANIDHPECSSFLRSHGPMAVWVGLTLVNYQEPAVFEHAWGPSRFQSLMASFMWYKLSGSRQKWTVLRESGRPNRVKVKGPQTKKWTVYFQKDRSLSGPATDPLFGRSLCDISPIKTLQWVVPV